MGNDFKLKEGRFGLDIRKKFFTPAILALPETVVFFFSRCYLLHVGALNTGRRYSNMFSNA